MGWAAHHRFALHVLRRPLEGEDFGELSRAAVPSRPCRKVISGMFSTFLSSMKTGATVASCSQVLKEAGAAGVYVVTVARG